MEKKHRKSVTIIDIAKECSISTATVSRVLSESNYPVSPEIQKLVINTAEKLGYTYKTKKQNTSPSIGIIVPSLQNSFFVQVITGISQQALSMGYIPHIFCSQKNINNERNAINHLLQQNIMGLLLESVDTTSKCLKNYIAHGGKVCLFDWNFSETLNGAMISRPDSYKSAQLAVEYLIERGHRNIAIISAPLEKLGRKNAVRGCLQTMVDHKIDFSIQEDTYIANKEYESSMYDHDMGMKLAKQIIDSGKKYTAVVALNDLFAIGAISQFRESGIRVPEDISVVGIDDIPMSKAITPSLTTVRVSSEIMGKSACQILINSINNKENAFELNIDVQPRIVERETVKDLRG